MNKTNIPSFKGRNHTEEAKAKISSSLTGHKMSEKTREKLLAANAGRHLSEGNKEKLRKANLGRKPSAETKAKMSIAQKGRKHPQEVKDKMSQAKMGHEVLPETRAKLSTALKGRVRSPFSGEHRHKLSESNRRRVITPETRKKMSQSRTGMKLSEQHCSNIGKAAKANWANPEWKTKTLEAMAQGRQRSAEAKRSRLLADKSKTEEAILKDADSGLVLEKPTPLSTRIKISRGRKGIVFSEQQKLKISQSKKTAWADPEWRDKVIKLQRQGAHVHPNKAEMALAVLLDLNYPGEWKFVGDGALIIGGKNPDFARVDGKKELIELFGNFWHKGENPQDRIDLFDKYGFRTLVVWEEELKCLEDVSTRIATFRAYVPMKD
jgi:hypothetical protein